MESVVTVEMLKKAISGAKAMNLGRQDSEPNPNTRAMLVLIEFMLDDLANALWAQASESVV